MTQAPAFSVARAWRSSPSSLSLLFIDRIALPAGRMMRPGALNEGTAKGFDFAKAPQRGTFRRRAAGARRESHLEFAGEVVSENAGEHVQLVSNPRP